MKTIDAETLYKYWAKTGHAMKKIPETAILKPLVTGVIWALMLLALQYTSIFVALSANPPAFSSKEQFKRCLIPYNAYVIVAEKIAQDIYYFYNQIPDKDNN